jgi:hypothetical protein
MLQKSFPNIKKLASSLLYSIYFFILFFLLRTIGYPTPALLLTLMKEGFNHMSVCLCACEKIKTNKEHPQTNIHLDLISSDTYTHMHAYSNPPLPRARAHQKRNLQIHASM